MPISIAKYKLLNSNQKYGCSICEFCGEIVCYACVFDAELGHQCDEQQKAWRNPSVFNPIPENELPEPPKGEG